MFFELHLLPFGKITSAEFKRKTIIDLSNKWTDILPEKANYIHQIKCDKIYLNAY